jgi:predicted metal-dependent peptidase
MFSKTQLTDKHIQDIIALASKQTGKPEQFFLDIVAEKMQKIGEYKTKSPILYDTIADNVIESAAFNILEEHGAAPKGTPKFSNLTFMDLFRRIRVESRSLFPLRNFFNKKALEPRIILMPDPEGRKEYDKYNDVKTAAATPNGEFIFYIPFMKSLLAFAHVKNIKPKGKKYSNNGGDFPPEWAYIEFLIKHELHHYSYSDFHYQKKLKADPKIINWVGDFRSNYDLVKKGGEQIPLGLFSVHVNYDKQKTYKEMYEIVKKEFDKLKPQEQKDLEDIINDIMQGDHGSHGDSADDDDSEGSESDGSDDGDITKDEDGPHSKNSTDIEIASQDEEDKVTGKSDGTSNKKTSTPSSGSGSNGKVSVDYKKFAPTFSWKKLLNKLIVSNSQNVDTTFKKPHNRNITNTHIIAQAGAGAIKPSELVSPSNSVKLLIIEDSSGSMSRQIGQIHTEIARLVKDRAAVTAFAMIKFSGTHECYVCSFDKGAKGTYYKVDSYKTMKRVGDTKPFDELLNTHFGTSTNFSASIVEEAETLIKDGFNVLVISDSDITESTNLKHLKSLYGKYRKHTFALMSSENDYHLLLQNLGEFSNNITYFK